MSLNRLPIRAANIMLLFSHLDSTSIAHAIIQRAAERKFLSVMNPGAGEFTQQTVEQANVLIENLCEDGEWSEVDFNALIMCCLRYSLLRVTAQGGSKFYSMHILVQSYLRAKGDMIRGHRAAPLVIRLLGSSTTYSTDHKYRGLL